MTQPGTQGNDIIMSKADKSGLAAVQDSLRLNNGGIPSAAADSTLAISPQAPVIPDAGPPLGPASTARAPRQPLPPASAPVVSTSAPVISTFALFGMVDTPKNETAAPMAKHATKNIEILADVTRQSQARIEKLSLDLGNLTIELRLGSQHSLGSQIPAHSIISTSTPPTPPSETGELEPEPSVAEDLQNLFDRVYDLEGFVRRATGRDGGDEALFERVSALEDPLATRFDEITSDRDKLSVEIRFQAEKQAKIDAKVRLEQKEMTKAIEDMQRTIARLDLGSAAPLRLPARASDHRIPSAATSSTAPPFHPRSPPALPFRAPEHRLPIERSRSPAGQPPSKRSRLADIEGTLTMGPLESSNLSPRELFTSLVSGALPSFDLATVSLVMLDPVYPCHLRVTLPSSFAVDNLIAVWNTGSRTTRMRALTTNNDSASFGPTRGRSRSVPARMPRIPVVITEAAVQPFVTSLSMTTVIGV
ncbi:hypothetical protein C8J57DRAFT_1613150 [Mycena rebaudengoi]|nr:hypothetical protein C8J57DRAFT_1613150 [Mycena rebaudengoi]